MSVRPVDPARSRVVLLGTAAYSDESLPDIPQVAANLTDLSRVLTDPELGGFGEQQCVVVPAGAGVEQVGELLHEAAGQAEDLLLFYYAGHGVLGRSGELYLSLRNTRLRSPEYSGLRFETVRGTFLDSGAANRVVIIDSCYSGRAIGPTLSATEQEVIGQLEITGTYTLTSAPANSLALVRDGEAHTAFTGRLLDLISNGSEKAGDLLSLGEIYRHLHTRLRADGLPLPQQRGTATTDQLGLVHNKHPRPPQPAPPTLDGNHDTGFNSTVELCSHSPLRDRALALAATAERAARALLPDGDASCMADLAAALAAVDRTRAIALLDSARANADNGPTASAQGPRQYRCTRAYLALDNAEYAARFAAEIPDDYWRARALVEVAEFFAATDGDRAVTLARQAYQSAAPVRHLDEKVRLVGLVGRALAHADTDRALAFAETADPPTGRALAYAEVARQIVGEHPHRVSRTVDKAVQALRTLDEAGCQDGLARVAVVIGPVVPDKAEDILSSIPLSNYRVRGARFEVARSMAAVDPDRAERMAAAGNLGDYEPQVLAAIACTLASTDPSRAKDLADRAEYAVAQIDVGRRARRLAVLVTHFAPVDGERASRLLSELKQLPLHDDYEAATIAEQMAILDPDWAATLADGIADIRSRVSALTAIVSTWISAGAAGIIGT